MFLMTPDQVASACVRVQPCSLGFEIVFQTDTMMQKITLEENEDDANECARRVRNVVKELVVKCRKDGMLIAEYSEAE